MARPIQEKGPLLWSLPPWLLGCVAVWLPPQMAPSLWEGFEPAQPGAPCLPQSPEEKLCPEESGRLGEKGSRMTKVCK